MNTQQYPILKIKKLTKDSITPTLGTSKSAGYDLYASESIIVNAGDKALIPIGISIEMPNGVYGRIAPRSSISWKYHTDIGAGVIDQDYRGEIKVLIFNHSGMDLQISKGQKIAQLILEKYLHAKISVVENLSNTKRGNGGFGSTDKK